MPCSRLRGSCSRRQAQLRGSWKSRYVIHARLRWRARRVQPDDAGAFDDGRPIGHLAMPSPRVDAYPGRGA
eukprot:scaffold20042_cov32-Tisochrysis_lutea.AAC.3